MRMCRATGCCTRLSLYNPGERCWIHTPDRAQRECLARMMLSPRLFERGQAIIELTPDEQRRYEQWYGAHWEGVTAY